MALVDENKVLTIRLFFVLAVTAVLSVCFNGFALAEPAYWSQTPASVRAAYEIDPNLQTTWKYMNIDKDSDGLNTTIEMLNLRTGSNLDDDPNVVQNTTPALSPQYHVQVLAVLNKLRGGTRKDKDLAATYSYNYSTQIIPTIQNENMLELLSGLEMFHEKWSRESPIDPKDIEESLLNSIFLSTYDIDYTLSEKSTIGPDGKSTLTAQQRQKLKLIAKAKQDTLAYMAETTTQEQSAQMMGVVAGKVRQMKDFLAARQLTTRTPPEGVTDPSHPWYRLRLVERASSTLNKHYRQESKWVTFTNKKILLTKQKIISSIRKLI